MSHGRFNVLWKDLDRQFTVKRASCSYGGTKVASYPYMSS